MVNDDQSSVPQEPERSTPVVLTRPAGAEPIVEPARIEPRTEATEADRGTKMFVLFFFLVVPPLGVVLLAAVCWSLFKQFLAT